MTKVFLIDGSLIVRNGFKKLFSCMDDIELIGEAENPVDAFDVFKKVGLPDLFILDIKMSKMDGLTFLKQINEQRPTSVIICSAPEIICSAFQEEQDSNILIDMSSFGVTGIIEKPRNKINDFFATYKEELIDKIRAATKANINYHSRVNLNKTKKIKYPEVASAKIIAIGSSTGGVQVLEEIFTHLNSPHIGIVVVQHITKNFSTSLANNLNELAISSIVREIEDGDIINDNTIYIAPGGIHVEIEKQGLKYCLRLKDFAKVNSHRPSINVLFDSVAKTFKSNAIGFLLTGMGDDGAKGLKNMRDAGAQTYVQDEKTSTVYGMPKVAYEMGSAQKALSVSEIIQVINVN
ncbi:MAG: chemotaxis-specific protein-glutamate methyltransferase CheB [Sulfurimonas sp.]|nr:chemotaxis-specific protein-glutamate methyltransferase CheB [Sulfurimonas sp.]